MKRLRLVFSIVLFTTLLATACVPVKTPTPQAPVPTLDPNTIINGVVKILQTQEASQPTSTPYVITATPLPATATPLPTATPIVVAIPCDRATFVGDVTIPDGTLIAPGETFIKTWRIRNTGTCTWTPAYQIVFDSGDLLGGPTILSMPSYVLPGQTVDITMDLVAPDQAGIFEGLYLLEDPNGQSFGVGSSGDVPFDVQIVVGSTPVPFTVRHVLMSVDTSAITITCPPGHIFKFTADVVTNGPGTVTYYWEFSNGKKSELKTLSFPAAGEKTVTGTLKLGTTGQVPEGNPYTGWARLFIEQPNHQAFEKIYFTITCN